MVMGEDAAVGKSRGACKKMSAHTISLKAFVRGIVLSSTTGESGALFYKHAGATNTRITGETYGAGECWRC